MNLTVSNDKIRGNSVKCLKHYYATLPTAKGEVKEARTPFVTFTGMSHSGAIKALKNAKEPFGENGIKARYFLYHHGYAVTELESLRSEIFELGNLLALGFFTVNDLVQRFERHRDSVLAVLLARHGTSKSFLKSAADLVKKVKHENQEEINSRMKEINSARLNGRLRVPIRGTPIQSTAGKSNEELCAKSVDSLGHMIEAMIPLAEYVLSDQCDPEDRQRLRQGKPGSVFELSNLLNGLCSETARKSCKNSS